MLDRLAFRTYRCFPAWEELQLGQLSMLYGANDAGKSAVARLLPWLSASRRPGSYGFDMAFPGLRGAGYRDVAWRGPGTHDHRPGWWGEPDDSDGIAVALRVGGSTATWWTEWRDEGPLLSAVAAATAAGTWRADVVRRRESRRPPFAYTTSDGRAQLTFDGIIPRAVDSFAPFVEVLDKVIWLGTLREGPRRGGTPRGTVIDLGESGAGAQAIALSDAAILAGVSAWYMRHARYEVVRETLASDADRLVLRATGDARYDIAFADVGEGLQQVFPVLVALETLRRNGGLLSVEEPESHLHPMLQEALADQIVDVLRGTPTAQVMLETHSEVFLLAALAASLDDLPVRLHWVAREGSASRLEAIELRDGRPTSDQLDDAFATMGVLRRRLVEERRRRAH